MEAFRGHGGMAGARRRAGLSRVSTAWGQADTAPKSAQLDLVGLQCQSVAEAIAASQQFRGPCRRDPIHLLQGPTETTDRLGDLSLLGAYPQRVFLAPAGLVEMLGGDPAASRLGLAG